MKNDNKEHLGFISYITPKYVYLPIYSKENLNIRRDKKVFVGSIVGQYKNNNIYSPVSGKIVGVQEMNFCNEKILSLVIENNYLSKAQKIKGFRKIISNYTKKDANMLLEKYGLKRNFIQKKKLIIDLTIYKNHSNPVRYELINNTMEFLESIDALCDVFNLDATIFISNKDLILNENLIKFIGMYPEINIIVSTCKLDIKKYCKLNDYVVYNGVEILKIYEAFKRDDYYSYKYICVIDEKQIYYLKIKPYILLEEILYILKIKNKNVCKIIGNQIYEKEVSNLIIDEEIDIIVL